MDLGIHMSLWTGGGLVQAAFLMVFFGDFSICELVPESPHWGIYTGRDEVV